MIPQYLLDAIKAYLGWTGDDTHDDWINATVVMVMGAAQSQTGAVFLPTMMSEVFRPVARGCGCCDGCPPVAFEQWPVLSLTKVQIDGTDQDPSQYWVSPFGHLFKGDAPVPVQGKRMDFEYTAGFDPLPPEIVLAICAALGNMAALQGLTTTTLPGNATKISIVDVGSIDLGSSGFYGSTGDPIFGGYGSVFESYKRPQVGGHPCAEWTVLGFAPSAPTP